MKRSPIASSTEARAKDDIDMVIKDNPKTHSKKLTPKKNEEINIKNIDANSAKNVIFSKIFIFKNSLYNH